MIFIWVFTLIFKKIFYFPLFLYYQVYDHLIYWYYDKKKLFPGWGIHLFTGKFGQGKTSLMTIKAYKLAKKYPQLSILTNLKLSNFPDHTRILKLDTPQDIVNAPDNTLVLIDEIGTIFNNRDYNTGEKSVPKTLFQHLCQCRKRHMMIYGTVQRFNLLDKQIRDITATVTDCQSSCRYPFTREITGFVYDIDEYEAWCINKLYNRRVNNVSVVVQLDQYRHLYDTTELIKEMLKSTYITDEEVLRNQGSYDYFVDGCKEAQKAYRKSVRRRR